MGSCGAAHPNKATTAEKGKKMVKVELKDSRVVVVGGIPVHQQPGAIVEMGDKEAQKYIEQNWAVRVEAPKRGRPTKETTED